VTDETPDYAPKISVLVTITDGAPNLDRCLTALENQLGAPSFEILVPVHPGLDEVESIKRRHPSVRCIVIDNLPFDAKPEDPGLRHIVYDHRRGAGLRAARGEIVAMTEDHAIPPPDWCARVAAAHAGMPYAVIGSGIDPACHTYLSWAAYFCEFVRFQSPVPEGATDSVCDVNVSYKRQALETVRDTWDRYYHETAVHGALMAKGEILWLTPNAPVNHDRGALSLGAMCKERVAWARIFAGRRAEGMPLTRRLTMAIGTPAIPFLFLLRRWAIVKRTRRNIGRFLAEVPVLLILYGCWSYGEFMGYLTRRATGASLQIA
jgi:hypothetical protein